MTNADGSRRNRPISIIKSLRESHLPGDSALRLEEARKAAEAEKKRVEDAEAMLKKAEAALKERKVGRVRGLRRALIAARFQASVATLKRAQEERAMAEKARLAAIATESKLAELESAIKATEGLSVVLCCRGSARTDCYVACCSGAT